MDIIYINEDNATHIFNISIRNTITLADADSNITEVNITLPTGFTYLAGTNGTSANESTTVTAIGFINFSYNVGGLNVISWRSDALVSNDSFFWFNATATTPGNYTINVTTTNATGAYSTNLSVSVNDTTAPFYVDTLGIRAGENISNTMLLLNLTSNDSFSAIDTIRLIVFNASLGVVNATNSSAVGAQNGTANLTISTIEGDSGLPDGYYILNISANDTRDKVNATFTRTILLDRVIPINITLTSPAESTSSATDGYDFSFTVYDANYITNCSLYFNDVLANTIVIVNNDTSTNIITNSSLPVGNYYWSVNCTDSAGNTNVSTEKRTLTVTAAASTTTSSSGSGSTGRSFWSNTFNYASEEIKDVEPLTRNLAKKNRVKVKVNGENHFVGVIDLTTTQATVNVSSIPQQAVMSVGDEKKFDVEDDGYYDLLVKLVSIEDRKANIIITGINEEITVKDKTAEVVDKTKEAIKEQTEKIKANPKTTAWIIAIIVIIVLVGLGIGYKAKKRK